MVEEKKKMTLQAWKLQKKLGEHQQQQLLLPGRLHLPPMHQWVALPNQLAEEEDKDEVPFRYKFLPILTMVHRIQTNQKENEKSHAAAWKSFSTN